MVEQNFNIFNFKSQPSLKIERVSGNNNDIVVTSSHNNNSDGNKNSKDSKDSYIKILVNDPFNNRKIILKATKKQKGVYL